MKFFILTFIIVLSLSVHNTFGQQNGDRCLIAYYPFDGNTLDVSGHGNNAINHNASLCSGHLGNSNSAYELSGNVGMNGSNHYIEIPNMVDSLDYLTISLWVKQNSYSYNQYGETYISFGTLPAMGTVSTSIYYDYDYNTIRFVVMTDSAIYSCYTPYLNSWVGTFQHFAMVYDSYYHTLKGYHNGSLVASFYGAAGKVKALGNYAGIGKHWWANAAGQSTRINGVFDEVKVYRCALDSNQILELFTSIDAQEKELVNLHVYPNPSHSRINFEIESKNLQNLKLSIYNSLGQKVRYINHIEGNVIQLDRFDLANGLYYYKLTDGQKIIRTGKFVFN